jgi:hypothetical protein
VKKAALSFGFGGVASATMQGPLASFTFSNVFAGDDSGSGDYENVRNGTRHATRASRDA